MIRKLVEQYKIEMIEQCRKIAIDYKCTFKVLRWTLISTTNYMDGPVLVDRDQLKQKKRKRYIESSFLDS